MLPIDSPRWSKIKTGFGTGESTAVALKRMHECIACDPIDQDELAKALYEVQCECDELYHQQSVYPATAATVPHLVDFIPFLTPKEQINTLVWIGWVAYESPDRNADDDIAEWYEQATYQAFDWAVKFAKDKDHSSDHTSLFEAIAILHDGGTLYYTFRDYYQYEFACPDCQLNLYAGHTNEGYKVWDAKHGSYEKEVDDFAKVAVLPAANPEEELTKPEHAHLRFFHKLFIEGDHQFMLKWEKQVLGQFPCPGCNEKIPIKYRWGS